MCLSPENRAKLGIRDGLGFQCLVEAQALLRLLDEERFTFCVRPPMRAHLEANRGKLLLLQLDAREKDYDLFRVVPN